MFNIHPTLEKDCIKLGTFNLSTLLLMNDCQYPWLILVPMKEGISEIYQLEESDQIQLLKESSFLSKQLMDITQADKLNVAALGNIVPQLHLHHIARFKNDACWPKPIWGQEPAIPYPDNKLKIFFDTIQKTLELKSNNNIKYSPL